jgi:hypothetical protein
VNCFSHLAQFSKLPTGGFEPLSDQKDLDNALYTSSSESSSPSSSESFFPFFFFAFSFALSFASAAFVSFRFLAVGFSSCAPSGSSSSSDAYPAAYKSHEALVINSEIQRRLQRQPESESFSWDWVHLLRRFPLAALPLLHHLPACHSVRQRAVGLSWQRDAQQLLA